MDIRLKEQLDFIIEIDKMKNIYRQTILSIDRRRENDAEHSWHIGVMAILLKEYAPENTDIDKVVKMLLIHDLVEVYAGDTFAYGDTSKEEKEEKELKAADKIFGILPEDLNKELRALWDEFEKMETNEAKYAASMDRIQPFILNLVSEGHTWKIGDVRSSQVYERMDIVKEGTPKLWEYVDNAIKESIDKGLIKK